MEIPQIIVGAEGSIRESTESLLSVGSRISGISAVLSNLNAESFIVEPETLVKCRNEKVVLDEVEEVTRINVTIKNSLKNSQSFTLKAKENIRISIEASGR